MAEPCLCFMTMNGRIHGMDVRKLIPATDEEKTLDWESLPPPPFDFTIDLPAFEMHSFVSDSKIHLAGGFGVLDDTIPSYKIYEFGFDIVGDEKKPRLNVVESIPEAPARFSFYQSLVADISGDCYFLVCDTRCETHVEDVFWVLRSGLGQWERLPPLPLLETQDYLGDTQWFVLHNKLFLPVYVEEDECVLCCFDPGTGSWTLHDDDDNCFKNSFDLENIACLPGFCLPRITVSSVPGLPGLTYSNCSVMLSCFYEEEFGYMFAERPRLYRAEIHALLVNQSGVCLFQRIEECFDKIEPSFLSVSAFLIDLGDSKVCAMLYGFAKEHDDGKSPVLCISVFTLTIDYEFVIEDPPCEQRFLSVHIISKRVYAMKDYLDNTIEDCIDGLQQVFICPPP